MYFSLCELHLLEIAPLMQGVNILEVKIRYRNLTNTYVSPHPNTHTQKLTTLMTDFSRPSIALSAFSVLHVFKVRLSMRKEKGTS